MFEREISVSTMSAQVARILGTRVVSGEFAPGASLPIESELCQAYGVSRSTIREAVENLAAKRLIEVAPKVGTRVLPFASWNLLDPDVLSWRLNAQFDRRIVEDLYEMRRVFRTARLFPGGAGRDRERCRANPGEDFADMVSMLQAPVLAANAETEFHLAIIAATHNGLFLTIGGAVKTALRVSFSLMQKGAGRPAMDLAPYDRVVAAILARRGEEASEAMRKLLELSRLRVLEDALEATSKVGWT